MQKEIKADYCIVGGGIAGILLAYKLAGTGKQIVLIDQGPEFSEQDRFTLLNKTRESLNDFTDYNDDTDPAALTPHTSGHSGDGKNVVDYYNLRLFGLGGTALHFQGIMMRPLAEDLKVKTLYGYGRDWPISYEELEPWFLSAEREIGVAANEDNPYASARSGPFPMPSQSFSYFDSHIFGPALEKLGIKGHSCPWSINSETYNGRPACQACRACIFCPTGARYSPDRIHGQRLKNDFPNVRILTYTSLRRLESSSKGQKIVAGHFLNVQDETQTIVRAESFVLTMGGIETPRALLLSAGEGIHKDGLGNMGGQLGRGFSDHDGPWVVFDTGKKIGGRLGYETMMTDHFRKNVDRRSQATFSIYGSPAIDWINTGHLAVPFNINNQHISLKNIRQSLPRCVTLWSQNELQGDGILELDKDKVDAFGNPLARVTMKMNDWDRNGYAYTAEIYKQIGEAMDVADVSEIPPPGSGLGYHPSGATAMADNPDEGVCDQNLKVFGLDNLHVVSNSVFPHMGSNPPTLTIAALALRLASHLITKG